MVEVVRLHSSPSLHDIPAMLRYVADRIEAGDHGEVEAAFMVIPRAGDYPTVFGWGGISGQNDPAIQFELAKLWLLTNMVTRV